MNDTYTMSICGLTRELPLVQIDDNTAYASFVIIGDTQLVKQAGKQLADAVRGVDYVLTAEAKGISLAYEISRQLDMEEFIVARKSVKSYMKDCVETHVESITTKGIQKLLLDGSDALKLKGKTVAIIDDVISTGESLRALRHLAEKCGAVVKVQAAVLAEGAAADRDDIVFLERLPLFKKGDYGTYLPM